MTVSNEFESEIVAISGSFGFVFEMRDIFEK